MNLSEFVDKDNETFELFDVNETEKQQQPFNFYDFSTVETVSDVVHYICFALGIPGNILSAIVWLRLHVASKNSSAVYLAVLAINDLVLLLDQSIHYIERHAGWPGWVHECDYLVLLFTVAYEPLLVLAFSVERLIAICCPLQVRGLRYVRFITTFFLHFNENMMHAHERAYIIHRCFVSQNVVVKNGDFRFFRSLFLPNLHTLRPYCAM